MKLNIFSIVLDGVPYIGSHLPMLNTLKIDWHWTVAEGAAMNIKDTAWCKSQPPRLSWDGTTEYLNAIRSHPRVTVIQKQRWEGKVEQVNACLAGMKTGGILLQMDADEIWSAKQLETLVEFFHAYPSIRSAEFYCRFFVGPNIVITSLDTYAMRPGDWHRAWRFEPGMKFLKHEPPVLNANTEPRASREATKECGLVFQHWAYALEAQVKFKEKYYGYHNAVNHWRQLQANTVWPVLDLKEFLPWVGNGVTADLLYKS